MNYYHYTNGSHLENLVSEGIIRATENSGDTKEKPAIWLTKSPEWEVACNIGYGDNPYVLESVRTFASDGVYMVTPTNDYMKNEIGMCRILISQQLQTISWKEFKNVGGISSSLYEALDDLAKSEGSPVDQWLCSFNEIPIDYWEGIEMFVNNHWVGWDARIPIEEFIENCLSDNSCQTALNLVYVDLDSADLDFDDLDDFDFDLDFEDLDSVDLDSNELTFQYQFN